MKQLLLTLLFTMTTTTISAQQTLDLWPEGPAVASSNAADTARITVFLPEASSATGRAVVCLPGGGYSHLAMSHEGYDWAQFFNEQGIALIVLKYRMPRGNRLVPMSDAEEAIRTVRRNAEAWHIDPAQVGIMGSSAGGHLASTIATHSTAEARPDFQILFYPVISMDPALTHGGSHDNFIGKGRSEEETKQLEEEFSNERQVTDNTPRAWIALSDDDRAVPSPNGVGYYSALRSHGVPASLHVYPKGGHGWGIRTNFAYHNEVLAELRAWLRSF